MAINKPTCVICNQSPAYENVTAITVGHDDDQDEIKMQTFHLCPKCGKFVDKYTRIIMRDAVLSDEQMFKTKALCVKMLQEFYCYVKQ